MDLALFQLAVLRSAKPEHAGAATRVLPKKQLTKNALITASFVRGVNPFASAVRAKKRFHWLD
jgi:hypothetical protein